MLFRLFFPAGLLDSSKPKLNMSNHSASSMILFSLVKVVAISRLSWLVRLKNDLRKRFWVIITSVVGV